MNRGKKLGDSCSLGKGHLAEDRGPAKVLRQECADLWEERRETTWLLNLAKML